MSKALIKFYMISGIVGALAGIVAGWVLFPWRFGVFFTVVFGGYAVAVTAYLKGKLEADGPKQAMTGKRL